MGRKATWTEAYWFDCLGVQKGLKLHIINECEFRFEIELCCSDFLIQFSLQCLQHFKSATKS